MPTLDPYSRFKRTPEVLYDGNITLGVWQKPSWLLTRPNKDLIRSIVVPASLEGRPDNIAHAIYGTVLLGWVIIAFNNAVDTLNWPRAGEMIEYPDASLVLPQLL